MRAKSGGGDERTGRTAGAIAVASFAHDRAQTMPRLPCRALVIDDADPRATALVDALVRRGVGAQAADVHDLLRRAAKGNATVLVVVNRSVGSAGHDPYARAPSRAHRRALRAALTSLIE